MMKLAGELKQALVAKHRSFFIYPLYCCVVLKVGQSEDDAEDPAASKDAVHMLPLMPVDELGPVIIRSMDLYHMEET